MENNENPINAPEEPKVEEVVEEAVSISETPNVEEPIVPESPKTDVVFADKPKLSKGMLLGMICLTLIASGGIGFGVWTMMDKNQQVDKLNGQISSLKSQVDELQKKVDEYEGRSDGFYEIVAPEGGEAEAVIEDGLFTIKNADGDVYMQDEEHEISEIVSCDSGTEEDPQPLTCIVATPNGEATIIYNFDDQSLEFIEATE